jgi:hypothetical protein
MRPEQEDVARPRDGDGAGLRRERSGLDRRLLVVEDDLVNLFERKAGDLDRRVGENKVLELDFELIQIGAATCCCRIWRITMAPAHICL